MAVVRPLNALVHDLARVPSLGAVIAPPYDVSDPVIRAALLARTPLNIIAADLAADPTAPLETRYAHSRVLLDTWLRDGVLVRDRTPALWALEQRFAGRARRGVFAEVRLDSGGPDRIRPHERTHDPAVADRLRLTEVTRTQMSPVFALHDDADGTVAELLSAVWTAPPHAEAVDDAGTVHVLHRIGDAAAIGSLTTALAGRELVIADGHHRHAAAVRYRDAHPAADHALMLLVAHQDPGLVVDPTHRLVRGGDRAALGALLAEHFDLEPVAGDDLPPRTAPGPFTLGILDGAGRAVHARLRDPAVATAAQPGVPEVVARLDTAILEALVLRALVLTADDVTYARSDGEARDRVADGSHDLAFFLRPCPVAQVAAVAAAGLTMPPKSTSFSPKVPTGLLLAPLDPGPA